MKKALRQQIRERLAAIPAREMHERSVAACRLLCRQPEFQKSETVMIFLSMACEVDTSYLAIECWNAGKRVLAPRISWDQRRMLPTEISSLTNDVRESAMGIREPHEGMPFPVSDIDLVVVPGLAYDARGERLGRGRGFYDRFLAHRDLRAFTTGLAFEEQIVASVPTADRDQRVRMIVTDQRVIRPAP